MKKYLLIVALILLMSLFVLGCADENNDSIDGNDIPFYSTDEEVFDIETPYCILQYPVEWEDSVIISSEDFENKYKVNFVAVIEGDELQLFDIVFESDEGDSLGTLKKDGKDISVSLISYNPNLDGYTEEAQMNYGGMGEDINVIISKLLEKYDFELAM